MSCSWTSCLFRPSALCSRCVFVFFVCLVCLFPRSRFVVATRAMSLSRQGKYVHGARSSAAAALPFCPAKSRTRESMNWGVNAIRSIPSLTLGWKIDLLNVSRKLLLKNAMASVNVIGLDRNKGRKTNEWKRAAIIAVEFKITLTFPENP